MKTVLYFITLLLFPLSVFSQTELEVNAPITSSTVHFDKAQIFRKGNFTLKNKKTTIVFKGISPSLAEKSIRVKEDDSFMILKVEAQRDYLKKTEETELLSKTIEDTKEKIDLENTHIEILNEQLEFLKANRGVKGNNTTISPADYQALSKIYFEEISKLKLELLERGKTASKLQEELTKLEAQHRNTQTNHKYAYEIRVEVEGTPYKNSKIELSYIVGSASWKPSYDIRFKDLESPLLFTYKAEISQSTGVAWDNIDLTLSTSEDSHLPYIYTTLRPQYLDMKNTDKKYSDNGYYDDDDSAEWGNWGYVDEDEEFKLAQDTEVIEKTTATEYFVGAKQSFKSQNSSNTIQFFQKEFDATYKYQCLPKIDNNVYFVALISGQNISEIDGDANLYAENSFVGESYVRPSLHSDTLEVFYGADPFVKVQRELVKNFTAEQSLGAYTKESMSYKISVKNTKATSIPLKISDQVPVSNNKEIVVEIEELSNGHLADNGIVTWDIELAPNESREFILSYTVKYPKKEKIDLYYQ